MRLITFRFSSADDARDRVGVWMEDDTEDDAYGGFRPARSLLHKMYSAARRALMHPTQFAELCLPAAQQGAQHLQGAEGGPSSLTGRDIGDVPIGLVSVVAVVSTLVVLVFVALARARLRGNRIRPRMTVIAHTSSTELPSAHHASAAVDAVQIQDDGLMDTSCAESDLKLGEQDRQRVLIV